MSVVGRSWAKWGRAVRTLRLPALDAKCTHSHAHAHALSFPPCSDIVYFPQQGADGATTAGTWVTYNDARSAVAVAKYANDLCVGWPLRGHCTHCTRTRTLTHAHTHTHPPTRTIPPTPPPCRGLRGVFIFDASMDSMVGTAFTYDVSLALAKALGA